MEIITKKNYLINNFLNFFYTNQQCHLSKNKYLSKNK